MLYSLLDLIVCPDCGGGLAAAFPDEVPSKTAMRTRPARRMGPAGAAVGPLPEGAGRTGLAKLVEPLSSKPVSDGRDSATEVGEGLLLCLECESWHPVRDGLPEILPLHLRFWDEDRAWLERFSRAVRAKSPQADPVVEYLLSRVPDEKTISAAAAADPGAAFKIAEMSATRRPLPEGFFGPAALAPFNPCRPQFSVDLIARFASAVPLLRSATNGLVLDLGCGYGWTTEWLVRLGFRAVGLDLNRDYVLAGRGRMGDNRPYLVVGDAERPPLRSGCADAVLAFDAFHHVPGRRRALSELGRVLKPGGRVAMVEPGPGHEEHPGSVSAMKRHGILERGVDPAALAEDVRGTKLGHVRAHPSPEPT
ncbi:MAG: methyltransferase domain-containing protein, partial [Candidatus Aminicenantes bacterium]|nr:methyltransferase domain-containing protein [Candidatus Aminicenantes bacterium]